MVSEILTFDFCLEEKRKLQAHDNEKMKELVYTPPNIVRCW